MRLALPWRVASETPLLAEIPSFEQPSLAVEHVAQRLAEGPRSGVLDLGSPTPANLALYARHGASITFADLYRFYAPTTRSTGPTRERFADALPHTPKHIDVVLAWDLFDYLSLEEIAWLGAWLRDRLVPGAFLYALVSCRGSIPPMPSFFTIADGKSLHVEESGPRDLPAPGHSEHALLAALDRMSVRSRFQLRRSVVEYLFVWD